MNFEGLLGPNGYITIPQIKEVVVNLSHNKKDELIGLDRNFTASVISQDPSKVKQVFDSTLKQKK